MAQIADGHFTVPEAAFLVGLSERIVNREIDERIIPNRGGKATRRLEGPDMIYLWAVRNVRRHLDQSIRKQMWQAIATAVEADCEIAKVESFTLFVSEIERELLAPFETLERMRRDHIETRPDIMGGEPVIKGTRIPVRHIASLRKEGVSPDELAEDFDLTPEQVEAAVVFDRVSPKRGRPSGGHARRVHVPAN